METYINKDTKIYCSFTQKAGNRGCMFFNNAFKERGINAIYRSFSVDNIVTALQSAKYLGFSGCAISMPFKTQAYALMDKLDTTAILSGSVNTILFTEDGLKGFNTDYIGAKKVIETHNTSYKKIYILGKWGLATAVKAASLSLDLETEFITRDNRDKIYELKNSLIYNCTPLSLELDASNTYIDCSVETQTGQELNLIQAKEQFKIYGYKY